MDQENDPNEVPNENVLPDPQEKKAFEELMNLIDYFRKEYDLTYGNIIAILEIAKHEVLMEAYHVIGLEDEKEDHEDPENPHQD